MVTTSQCNGGAVTVTPSGSRRLITLNGGSIPANCYCTVTVDTTSATIGTYPNVSGVVTALINGAPVGTDTASATLTVTAAHPAISILKQVSLTGSDRGSRCRRAGWRIGLFPVHRGEHRDVV